MQTAVPTRLMKRLTAAEGYLDLELPECALRELNSVTDAGPYSPTVEFLKGEALIALERFDEAIIPLQRAAAMIPAPAGCQSWEALKSNLESAYGDPQEKSSKIMYVLGLTRVIEHAIDAVAIPPN